jgi:hypothetical protein
VMFRGVQRVWSPLSEFEAHHELALGISGGASLTITCRGQRRSLRSMETSSDCCLGSIPKDASSSSSGQEDGPRSRSDVAHRTRAASSASGALPTDRHDCSPEERYRTVATVSEGVALEPSSSPKLKNSGSALLSHSWVFRLNRSR